MEGPGCHLCPCPCPPRAMTSCGTTTRRSWPTKPCGSWTITWLSSGTSRCPPARPGGVGDRGNTGGGGPGSPVAPPGAHRQAGPKARGLRQCPAPPGGSAERQEKGRGQNRQGWDPSGPLGTAPTWGQSPGRGDKATAPPCPSPQAEEEFNKAQAVFEDLNRDLREELPVLYGRYGAVTGAGDIAGPRGDAAGIWGHRGAGGHCGGCQAGDIVGLGDIARAWGHHGLGAGDIVGLGDSAGAGGHCGAGGHGLGTGAIRWVSSPHGREELARVSPQSPPWGHIGGPRGHWPRGL